MSSKVTLKISKGALAGKEITEKETVIIGRANDCHIILDDPTVSRYHCIMEIHPPTVIVRDFGSKNGTYLNGKLIGQRAASMSAEEGKKQIFSSSAMKSGDCLGICKDLCYINVNIVMPDICAHCRCEIDELRFHDDNNQPLCSDCHEKIEEQKRLEAKLREEEEIALIERENMGKCEICGSPLKPGAIHKICDSCQKDPNKLFDYVVQQKTIDNDRVKGEKIAHYRKIRLLGKGGCGQVWLVEDEKTGKQMALKLMLPEAAGSENGRLMFMREGYIATQLKHTNVVNHEVFGSTAGMFYIAMEYCEGGSVDDLMKKKGGKLDIDLATHIILQVLDGLHYTHETTVVIPSELLKIDKTPKVKGVVHRDFKPGNIFLSNNSSKSIAKVADFGMAKAFELAGFTVPRMHTGAGTVLGTIAFQPRQQLTKCGESKSEVDVWAAAASYYNMLTGAYPRNYTVQSFEGLYYETLKNKPISIRLRNSKIPERLAKVIDTALIEVPEIGIKSAWELKKSIESAL